MEAFSPGWWLSLLAIVLIDLVLTGERAVLIAEAARQLPRRLYGGALAAGTVLALLLRVLMTVGLLWLLQTPGLLLLGGIVLLGIAWRTQARRHRGLVLPDTPAQGFWGTLRSVVVAEALMGLDNVLAVAGAARNSVDLVVIGLLLTVPMIVFGSRHLPRLLAQLPLHISLREDLDRGEPTVVSNPESEFTTIYRELASKVASQLFWKGDAIPTEIAFRAV